MTAPRPGGARPPLLAVVGKKHAGKTTLMVRLSAELARRGVRVMTLKHGSHTFNLDPSTTDTYRHYHEGHAERVAMASPDKFALVMRWERELTPEEIAERFLADADLVLCEGFKASAIPKVEVFRTAAHDAPLWSPDREQASSWRVVLTDMGSHPALAGFDGVRFDLGDAACVGRLADWVETEILGKGVR